MGIQVTKLGYGVEVYRCQNKLGYVVEVTELRLCFTFHSIFRFGHVFLVDSGSSVGEIVGHSKPINSVSYKPTRPYRIATCSEDFTSGFFEGPPFKFKQSNKVRICC